VVADLTPLAGRCVLITGASRGIGAATATRVTALGAVVIRVARSAMPPLAGAVDLRADLADPKERDTALRRISNQYGVPDAIVSNAGAFMIAPLAETTDALLREQLAINLEAPFAIARHFLPGMAARGHGIHVLVGSVADARPFTGNAGYAASKYGVRGLHEVLCEEFRGTGVRCTLISPGPTDTAAWDPIDPDAHEGFTPRTEMLRPDDVAAAIMVPLTASAHVQIESIRMGPA
jgi:NAD(P)-dependent dehydrogenase (short-subunit alcohol dehydrogenase family)